MKNAAEHQRGGLSRFWYETTEWNAIICSFAFFLIFTAFGTVQNFATSTHGDSGAISLTILYAVLTFSNIIVPVLLNHLSPKIAMFLGSSTYAIYVAANIHEIDSLLYAAGALEGFGAAVLWVGQGSFITQCAYEYADKYRLDRKSQLGYYNGLFWAFMVGNQFVGNLIAAFLFFFDVSNTVVYTVLTTVNVIGVITFLFIRPFDSVSGLNQQNDDYNKQNSISAQKSDIQEGLIQHSNINEDDMTASDMDHFSHIQSQQHPQQNRSNVNKQKQTLSDIQTVTFIDNNGSRSDVGGKDKADIFSAFRMWDNYKLHLLILFTLYSGISQTFEYGSFPARIDDKSKKFFAMTVFGAFDAVFSLVFGRLSDKIGRLPVLTISFICHGAVYVYFYLYTPPQDRYYDYFIVAAFLGTGDAGFNTQLYALYASLLGEKSATFANLKFFQSISMTWGFLWQSDWIKVSWHNVLISCFALMVSSAIPLYMSKTVRTASRPKTHGLSFS